MSMRILVSLGALGLGAWAGVAAARPATRVVPCSDIILGARTGHDGGYRVVLGVVSVPPAYRPQVVPTGSQPWPYSSKAGLVIHAGRGLVSVSVPRAWRKQAAITWGIGDAASVDRAAQTLQSPSLGEIA
jgi:hypothetical protein